MAIHNIKKEMSDLFENEIKGIATAELSNHGVEVLIFDNKYLMEYMEWIRDTLAAGGSNIQTAHSKHFDPAHGGGGARGITTPLADGVKAFKHSLRENADKTPGCAVYDTAQGLKIFNVVSNIGIRSASGKMGTTSYFQGRTQNHPESKIRTAVKVAKRHAIYTLVGGKDKVTTDERTTLMTGQYGHHGGVNDIGTGRSIDTGLFLGDGDAQRGNSLIELYNGNIRGEGMPRSYQADLTMGTPDADGTYPTTGGMLKGMQAANEHLDGGEYNIRDLMDADIEITTENLAKVVYTDLRAFFLAKMGWEQEPLRQLSNVSQKNTIEVYNQIFVVFARGGPAGNDYSEAMKDYDAGKQNGLVTTLNKVLDNIEIETVKKIIKYYGEAHVEKLLNLKGSPSVIEHTISGGTKKLVKALFDHKSTPDMRFKVNKALMAQEIEKLSGAKVKPQAMGKKTKGKRKTGGAKKLPAVVAAKAVKDSQRKRSIEKLNVKADSTVQLRNLLNKMVPTQVARNMRAPRLRFRTGRLANSVRVSQITTGPRGGNVQIETDYATDPYAVYAPGGKRYTQQRDPERLIKKSVREVAQAMIGPRFGIRVNR